MRFMMLIQHKEVSPEVVPPPSLHEAMGEFVTAELSSGRLVDTNGLRPTREGKRIRSSNGKLTFTDGPFPESKELVGGYAIVEAGSWDEAMELATKFMEIHRVHWPECECTCEVRPVDA